MSKYFMSTIRRCFAVCCFAIALQSFAQSSLSPSARDKVCNALNDLLSEYAVLSQSVRSLHWHIRGDQFFTLHEAYQKLYDYANDQVDLWAERIIALDRVPLITHEAYAKKAKVRVITRAVTDPTEGVRFVVESLRLLRKKEEEILNIAKEVGDEGTSTMIADVLPKEDKMLWMYNAYLQK